MIVSIYSYTTAKFIQLHTWHIHTHVRKCTLVWHLLPNFHCTELNICFRESEYTVNEGDQQSSIILRLKKEVQNSFTVTLYPVSITEALDPASRFNVSAFITSVTEDAQATPGKGVVPSQKFMLTPLKSRSVQKHTILHRIW